MSPQNVIMGGDSAGGNLVGALLMLIRQMRLEKELKIMHGTNTDSKTHISIKKTKTKSPVLFHSLTLLYLISSIALRSSSKPGSHFAGYRADWRWILTPSRFRPWQRARR